MAISKTVNDLSNSDYNISSSSCIIIADAKFMNKNATTIQPKKFVRYVLGCLRLISIPESDYCYDVDLYKATEALEVVAHCWNDCY